MRRPVFLFSSHAVVPLLDNDIYQRAGHNNPFENLSAGDKRFHFFVGESNFKNGGLCLLYTSRCV